MCIRDRPTTLSGGGSESNDLSASVTWANVPDANITQGSVTQHQAALTITKSQVSDFGTYLSNLSEDSSPQLGGNLDVNGNSIVSVSNANISITPNGSGKIVLDGLSWPTADGTSNYVLKTDGSGTVSYTHLTLPTILRV